MYLSIVTEGVMKEHKQLMKKPLVLMSKNSVKTNMLFMKWGLVTHSPSVCTIVKLLCHSHRAVSSFHKALLWVIFFFRCLRFHWFGVMWFAQDTSGSGRWTWNYHLFVVYLSFWLHGKLINACVVWFNGSTAPNLDFSGCLCGRSCSILRPGLGGRVGFVAYGHT